MNRQGRNWSSRWWRFGNRWGCHYKKTEWDLESITLCNHKKLSCLKEETTDNESLSRPIIFVFSNKIHEIGRFCSDLLEVEEGRRKEIFCLLLDCYMQCVQVDLSLLKKMMFLETVLFAFGDTLSVLQSILLFYGWSGNLLPVWGCFWLLFEHVEIKDCFFISPNTSLYLLGNRGYDMNWYCMSVE